MEFSRHRLRRVIAPGGHNYAIICDGEGLWHRLDWRNNDQPVAAVKDAVVAARRDTLEYIHSQEGGAPLADGLPTVWPGGSSHWKSIAHLMAIEACSAYEAVEDVAEGDLNRRGQNEVIPIAGGGGWSLRENRRLSPADMMPMLLMASGWHVPEPDMSALDATGPEVDMMRDAIEGRFAGVFERMSTRMIGPSKTVDIIQAPLSSYGKSTLIDILKECFPGSVDVISGKNAFSQQGTKFDALGKKLCGGAWAVFVDECEKGQGDKPLIIGSEAITAVTGTTLSVEEKGKPERSMLRTATPILLGADWPFFNADAQGIKTRFVWAVELQDSAGIMTSQERSMLIAPAAVAYLRAWMVKKAHELLNSGDDPDMATRTEFSNSCVAEMMETRSDPLVAVLHENYEENPTESVTASEITMLLKTHALEIGVDEPQTNVRGALLRRAFPHIRSKRSAAGNLWVGIQPRRVPDAPLTNDYDDADDDLTF